MNIAIVVVGYNRPQSLARLLLSINNAEYNNSKPDLIIALDNNPDTSCLEVAQNFEYKHGEKNAFMQNTRFGLRKQIIFCGDLTKDYDAIVLLEDDLYVSPYFYYYTQKALEKYINCEEIAGISLYKFEWNQHAVQPFYPINMGNDAFFMQCAQSWGQVWSAKMWNGFKQWYNKPENSAPFDQEIEMPDNISQNWPSKSCWLKYYTKYMVKTNKYYVFPHVALSTNFNDVGFHAIESKTGYQVEMLYNIKQNYNFPDLDKDALKYNVFLENQDLHKYINKSLENLDINQENLCVDLYSINNNVQNKKYWITSTVAPYKIIKSYGRKLRPHDANILLDISGDEIFLYNTSIPEKINKTNSEIKEIKRRRIMFDVRETYWRDLLFVSKIELKAGLKRVALRKFKK